MAPSPYPSAARRKIALVAGVVVALAIIVLLAWVTGTFPRNPPQHTPPLPLPPPPAAAAPWAGVV